MTGRKAQYWTIAALVLLNLLLKLSWTGVNELAGDEPFTVYWAQRPLAALFTMLRTENNPPLYFLLMHGWSQLVPLDAGWLRVPSALFSALTVWPLFLVGARLGGRAAGITAALLFTFSQHSYGFAHEVRAYPLLVLACTWAVWQLLRLAGEAQRHPAVGTPPIVWLVLANVLATWAHYFGWIMVGLEMLMVFALPSLRAVRMRMLKAAAITVLFSLPLAGTFLSRASASLGKGTWVSPPAWDEPYSMLMRWSNAPVVAVLFLALIAVAAGRKKLRGMGVPLIWCGVPLLGMFLISFRYPMYIDRYLLFASPAFYLLAGVAAVSAFGGTLAPKLVPAGCVLAMGFTFFPWKDNNIHPSRVVAQVAQWREGPTAVLIQPAWYGLTYAWAVDPELYRGAVPVELGLREHGIFPINGAAMPPLDSSLATVVHIDAWAALTDPGQRVLHELRSRFTQVDSVEADKKVIVRLFQRR